MLQKFLTDKGVCKIGGDCLCLQGWNGTLCDQGSVTSFLLQLEMYTAKIKPLLQVVENRIQQCCWGNIILGFRQYCSSLLHLIEG